MNQIARRKCGGDDPQIVPRPTFLECPAHSADLNTVDKRIRFIRHVPPAALRDDLGIVPYGAYGHHLLDWGTNFKKVGNGLCAVLRA